MLFRSVYAGDNKNLDAPLYFGLAVSRDLVHWKKYAGNPVFRVSTQPDAWDNTNIWFGTTEKIGDAEHRAVISQHQTLQTDINQATGSIGNVISRSHFDFDGRLSGMLFKKGIILCLF